MLSDLKTVFMEKLQSLDEEKIIISTSEKQRLFTVDYDSRYPLKILFLMQRDIYYGHIVDKEDRINMPFVMIRNLEDINKFIEIYRYLIDLTPTIKSPIKDTNR